MGRTSYYLKKKTVFFRYGHTLVENANLDHYDVNDYLPILFWDVSGRGRNAGCPAPPHRSVRELLTYT